MVPIMRDNKQSYNEKHLNYMIFPKRSNEPRNIIKQNKECDNLLICDLASSSLLSICQFKT